MEDSVKLSIKKAAKSIGHYFPWMMGTILLISLIVKIIPQSFYTAVFSYNLFFDSFFGDLAGSIAAGNPLTSYIIGGELLKQGVSLIAVTAFLVSWVTVGIIQFPAESAIFGIKFAILRNTTSFIFAIVVALTTVLIMDFIT